MGPLGELGALFNPGMRHETEEKRAKQMLREEEGTGRKGRLGIDLDSGVAVIGVGDDRNGAETADRNGAVTADDGEPDAGHGTDLSRAGGDRTAEAESDTEVAGADGGVADTADAPTGADSTGADSTDTDGAGSEAADSAGADAEAADSAGADDTVVRPTPGSARRAARAATRQQGVPRSGAARGGEGRSSAVPSGKARRRERGAAPSDPTPRRRYRRAR